MDPITVFDISCWSFTTIVMTYNAFTLWGYLPRGFTPKSKLRKQALEAVMESDRPAFSKELDQGIVEQAKSAESLRLYIRFVKDYPAVDLNMLTANIRVARCKLRTTLLTANLTAEQLAMWSKFNSIMRDFWIDGSGPEVTKKRNDLGRTALYVLRHMDEADDVLKVIEERKVYQIKHIKALMKAVDETPASALSDGML